MSNQRRKARDMRASFLCGIIVPILPPKWRAERPSIPAFGRTRYLAQSWPAARHQSIAAFWNHNG
jgi:hypothetical protein